MSSTVVNGGAEAAGDGGDDSKQQLSDEEMRKLLKPCPTEHQVVDILKACYSDAGADNVAEKNGGKSARKKVKERQASVKILRKLDSYDDVNYMVSINGTTFLLKVHNGVESRDFAKVLAGAKKEQDEDELSNKDEDPFYKVGHQSSVIHLQNAMMELLNAHEIPTSSPIKPSSSKSTTKAAASVSGPLVVASLPVVSKEHSPTQLVVRLLSWLPGKPMADVPLIALETLCEAGQFLGKLDSVLDLFSATNELENSSSSLLEGGGEDSKPPATSSNNSNSPSQSAAATRRKIRKRGSMALESFGSSAALRASFSFRAPAGGKGTNTGIKSAAAAAAAAAASLEGGADENAPLDPSLLIAARRYHQWDGKNCLGLRKFVHCITTDKRRELVESVLDTFEKELVQTKLCDKFRKGVLHADFNDANILLSAGNNTNDLTPRISGVLDFGDSVESWRVLDVTVAMAYATLSAYGKLNRSISAAAGVLRGYNSVYPLLPLERQHLILLMAVRLATSVTLGAYSYQQNPANHYLLLHSEPAWKSLELLWNVNTETRQNMARAINRVFDQACLYTHTGDDKKGKSAKKSDLMQCFDLVIPDPGVADLLSDVRVSSSFGPAAISTSMPPPQKRLKTSSEHADSPKDVIMEENSDSSSSNCKPKCITFVTTHSATKLDEIKRIILGEVPSENSQFASVVKHMPDLPEIPSGTDLMAMVRHQSRLAADRINGPVVMKFSGLSCNALNGFPGPYTVRFMDKVGMVGLYKMIASFVDHSALTQTVVAFCAGPNADPAVFEGRAHGKLVPPRTGEPNVRPPHEYEFGWDAIFQPTGSDKTYAEMTSEEFRTNSPRTIALAQLQSFWQQSNPLAQR